MGRKILQFSPFLIVMFVLYSLFPSLTKLYKTKMVKKEVEDFFTDLMYQAVEQREKSQIKRDDYLEFLINMRKKKQFSELDMAAHGVTFFVGKIML